MPTRTPTEDRRSRPTESAISPKTVRATDLSPAVRETLWQDDEFLLSRAVRGASLPPLLTMTPAASPPGGDTVVRLERAYALGDETDRTWIARRGDRVFEAAEYIPATQLGTAADSGFAPFIDNTSTSRETACAKIGARVRGTALAREAPGGRR